MENETTEIKLNETEIKIREKYKILEPLLDEKTSRIWAAVEANSIGHGGQIMVSRATGINKNTVLAGTKEIKEGRILKEESDRSRKKGGGRKKVEEKYPTLIDEIKVLVEPSTLGSPENPLLWNSKSLRKIAEIINKDEHRASLPSISSMLRTLGYSLQASKKTKEGGKHPDRDDQFKFINEKVKDFQRRKEPVISVDTKKKELIGNYKNNGKDYHPIGKPPQVNVYDFLDKEKGKVAPYGIYDLDKNKGWVSVGISSDTAEFAVNSIRSWWTEMGKESYPNATEIYINADGGGSNSSRGKLWKLQLQKLATELNLIIHVSHFPPGTSKWNKIEHRMFCFISQNWRGKPLIDRATVVNLIGSTSTTTGLKIRAKLDESQYQKGIKVSDEEWSKIILERDEFHGEWNYTISPFKS